MGKPFDAQEAERLTLSALALQEELLDEDAEVDAAVALAREAERRSRDRARFSSSMQGLWRYMAGALERGDMEIVRGSAEAIEREVRAEFERREKMG